MLKKLLCTFAVVSVSAAIGFAQTGALKIKLGEKSNNEPMPFVNIIVELNGSQVGSGTTNIDGECIIKPLTPGKYIVKASSVGFQSLEYRDVIVSADKTSYLDAKMANAIKDLPIVEIVTYSKPLIDPDTKTSSTVTREEYDHMASKDVNSVAATTAGVYQADNGKDINVRGGRSEANVYYIDGQRVIGSPSLPQGGVEQITTITGGTPAQFGDATGGVISITTRGPQSKFSTGVETQTSQFLDKFGYNRLGFNISGPLITKRDTTSGVKKPVLGFFISVQAVREKDPNPSAIGVWKVKDDVLSNLEENPLRRSPNGGYMRNAENITLNDLENVKAHQNSVSNLLSLTAKIDYKPTANLNLTLGASGSYENNHEFIYQYSLFNAVNNSQYIDYTWRTFAKLTQKFGNATNSKEEEKSASVIKNAFYTLQAGYSQDNYTRQDDSHQGNLFDYGYIGKFTQYQGPSYAPQNGKYGYGLYQNGFNKYLLTFEPSDLNPTGANYTKQYYSFVNNQVSQPNDFAQVALINGANAKDAYGLWYNTGRQYRGYEKHNTDQFNVVTSFSADVKNHAIQLGFEYEQRTYRDFFITPVDLWTQMYQLANFHLSQLDTANPILNPASGTFSIYDYNRKYDAATQKQFDKSLREKLGKDPAGTEWIDINSLDPSIFSLDMFSADDLLNNGNSALSGYQYYGYDYTGKKLKKQPSADDFFNKKDANGNYTRNIGAYQPIYIAGYIQDKFDFRDLKINVGLRVDRFDANQKVLKDKYLLYEAKTAGEVDNLGTHPANIGSDYVVYVNDKNSPTSIVGYRHNDTWYNAQGTEIADPAVLASATTSGKITPYLVNPNLTSVQSTVFKDYAPQINLMPRIAVAFPISDVANFFAHYDIITQRPNQVTLARFDPADYLFMENTVGAQVANPDLKPERKVNYELGFTQVLNEKKNSAINISAFYEERRNQIQAIKINQAYPVTYLTWGNIDFSTVKGFTVGYDLRRTGNVALTANYTLQFAEGTGSSASDGVNLINSGQPNLRIALPLSIDQRHAIHTNVDYRFASGKDYNGPVWTRYKGSDHEKAIQLFSDMGANLTFSAGSGTPYSRRGINSITAGRSGLIGSINGSNLPWTYRMDFKIDKDIKLTWGNKEGDEKKTTSMNVNLTVLNLLNTKNILSVYSGTGNASDDGYLASAAGQNAASQQVNPQSYKDLYAIYVNDPGNYSLPRRIRLGVTMNF